LSSRPAVIALALVLIPGAALFFGLAALWSVLAPCRHRWGWPITQGGETRQACIRCGDSRAFDVDTWRPM
jgi:hypothetical protein